VKICRVIRIKLNQLVYENGRIITILLRKWCKNNKHYTELAPQNGGKTAAMRKLRHCNLCIREKRVYMYKSTFHAICCR